MSESPADGVLVVDKPAGPTSHDVVTVARRTFGSRVGHTGTLDPLATGVLPLVIGRATRLAQFMTAAEKVYDATVVFGRETDTGDAAGATTRETGLAPDADALAAAVAALPGRHHQTPPVYSAKKIGGEPAYRLARRATPVAPAAVEVEIHEAAVLSAEAHAVQLRVRVSSGFYVRSLARDLGERLGVGAHLGTLRRLRAGPFDLSAAVAWERVVAGGGALVEAVVPLEQLLLDLGAAHLDDDAVARVRHGQRVTARVEPSGARPGRLRAGDRVRLLGPGGRLIGVAAAAPGPGEEVPAWEAAVLQPTVVLG